MLACIVLLRWMVRSSYEIGDTSSCFEDAILSLFCPCCVTNQLFQTTVLKGNPTTDGGKRFNVNPMVTAQFSCGACMYASLCMPCSIGSIMSESVGMPFLLGCCCLNLFNAKNIVRYHYRLRGANSSDCVEECLTPFCFYCVANIIANAVALVFPILYLCLFPAICGSLIGVNLALQQEASQKRSGEMRSYLRGYSVPVEVGAAAFPAPGFMTSMAPIQVHALPGAISSSPDGNGPTSCIVPDEYYISTSSSSTFASGKKQPVFASAVSVRPAPSVSQDIPMAEVVTINEQFNRSGKDD